MDKALTGVVKLEIIMLKLKKQKEENKMADEKDPNQAPPPNELLTPAEPPQAQPGEVVGPQQYAGEDEVQAAQPDPYQGNDEHSMQAARDGMPGFEAVPGDMGTTAQGLGNVAASGATKIPVTDGNVLPPQPTAEQQQTWDEGRAQNQQEWEKIAEERNKSRGLIGRHRDGAPTAMDVAHEEALKLDDGIDSRLMTGREQKFDTDVPYDEREPITTRQEMVNTLESEKRLGSVFNPKRNYDIWDKNRNWARNQERLDTKMAPIIQEISSALANGEFDAAGEAYLPYTFELRDYIERKISPQLSELASRLIIEGNSPKLAELLQTPFGLMLFRENLKVSDEQLRAPEIIKVVTNRAAEFIKNTFDRNDPERAGGTGMIFRLENRLKALSNIGAMNLGEILEAPQTRLAAVDAVVDWGILYDRGKPAPPEGWWPVEQFAKLGLTSPEEIANSHQYKEVVKQEVLKQVSSANPQNERYGREPSVHKFKSVFVKIDKWGVNAKEVASWSETKEAVEKFFASATEEMAGIRENWGIEYSENAFNGYLEKLKTLEQAGLVTQEDILAHSEFVKAMQARLTAIRENAEARKEASLEQSRRLRENADKPVKKYEMMAEAGREIGLAA
ncbi:MAG TPA: hypothetical protein VFP35_02605 [Candidatus Saccharimonadales bacterium]|nr:hypothetical protein [Candidatus Saccharimonadales bacterium]